MLHDKRSTQHRRQRLQAIYAAAILSCVVFSSPSAWAQRRWDGDVNNEWNFAFGVNWEEIGLPTAGAIFGSEGNDQPNVIVSGGNATTDFIDFESTATAYTITTSGVRLTVDDSGITNNSNVLQKFVNSGANSQLRLSNSATISGGANGIQITNGAGGSTLFINDSSAGDATILNNAGGTTRFEDTSGAGSANITNDGVGAVTRFIENSRGETATITNQNSGETVFEDTSGADGTNITNNTGGVTRFTEDSFASGNAQITNNNGGLTVFEGPSTVDDATITNQSGGITRFEDTATGSSNTTVVNNSGGQLDISGATGPVVIGSVSGAGDIFLGGTGALVVGSQNVNNTISGVIQNGGFSGGVDGTLIKEGTATLRLTGDNTYTGLTVVNDGTLQVDGEIASTDTIINNDGLGAVGTLTGTGGGFQIVGNVTNNGGRIAPGRFGSNAVGSTSRYGDLNVDGSVDINGDASRFDTRVSGSGSVNQLDVTGDVDLDGQVTVNAEDPATGGEYLVNNRYTIIHADGELTGTLDAGVNGNRIDPVGSNIDGPAFYFLDANVIADYTEDEVYLELTRNTLDDQVVGVELTENQQSLFDVYNDAIEADAVLGPDGEKLINDFILNGEGQLNLAGGDALTAFPLVAQGAANRFNQRMMGQAVQTQAEAAAKAADDDYIARRGSRLVYGGKRNLFAQAVEGEATDTAATGYTRRSNIWATVGRAKDEGNADGNGPGFDAKATDYQLGFNRSLSERTVVGLSIGKSDADVDIEERLAEGDVDTTSIGAFLRHDSNDWYWSGLLSYSRHGIDSERETGLPGTVTADFDARTLALWGEVGKKLVRGGWNIEPNLSLKFSNTKQDSFDEEGLGALSVDSSSYNSRRLGLGVRVTTNNEDARIRPRLSLGFERELGDDNVRLSNSLPFLGTFDVEGTQLGKNIFSARLGADARLNDRFSLTGEIGGSWRSNQDSHYLYGGVKYGW